MERQTLVAIFPPVFGLFLMGLGNGYLTTLVPLRQAAHGVSVAWVGYVMTAYYLGLCIGALFSERLLRQIGHIRAYACFAAVVSVSSLAMAISDNQWFWAAMRLICGVGTIGAYVVIESWLLAVSNIHNRGRILAFYMVSFYASMAGGQFMLGPLSAPLDSPRVALAYVFVGMITTLSLLPIATIPRNTPVISQGAALSPWKLIRLTPSGVAGAFGSGILMGAIYSLLPLYLRNASQGYQVGQIGTLMACVVIGGMALQYPVGRWSDATDRQRVLILVSAALLLLSVAVPLAAFNYWLLCAVLFLFGGGMFALYPVSISHAADRTPVEAVVGMTQGMLLINSVGSVLAAPLVTPMMSSLGQQGFFVATGAVVLVMTLFFAWRNNRRSGSDPSVPLAPMAPNAAMGSRLVVTEQLVATAEEAEQQRAASNGDDESVQATEPPAQG